MFQYVSAACDYILSAPLVFVDWPKSTSPCHAEMHCTNIIDLS